MSESFLQQRKNLVGQMKQSEAIESSSVENAFLNVKREIFFPEELKGHAYADTAFPIGFGQTISQPSTIAIMLEMLDVKRGMKILEVGAGSGYVLALLSELVGKKGSVFAIELLHELHQRATKTLLQLGYENIFLKCGDGTLGWGGHEQFDRILISAACSEIPGPLAEQLKEGGKIVAPIGNRFTQEITCLQKEKGRLKEIERKCCFVFVPLKGEYGFD